MTPIRRRRDPYRRQVLGVSKLPCAICGTPVPAGRRRCDPSCQPIVVTWAEAAGIAVEELLRAEAGRRAQAEREAPKEEL